MDYRQIVEIVACELSKYENLDSIELEARLGIYNEESGTFDADIGEDNYNIIKEMLESYKSWDSTSNTDVTDYFFNRGVRVSLNNSPDGEVLEVIRKKKLKHFTFQTESQPLDIRISLKTEEIIKMEEKYTPDNAKFFRKKRRVSRKHQDASFDLTIIETEEESQILQEFEYEVEYIGKLSKENLHEAVFSVLYKILDANYMVDGFLKTKDMELPLDLFSAKMVYL